MPQIDGFICVILINTFKTVNLRHLQCKYLVLFLLQYAHYLPRLPGANRAHFRSAVTPDFKVILFRCWINSITFYSDEILIIYTRHITVSFRNFFYFENGIFKKLKGGRMIYPETAHVLPLFMRKENIAFLFWKLVTMEFFGMSTHKLWVRNHLGANWQTCSYIR